MTIRSCGINRRNRMESGRRLQNAMVRPAHDSSSGEKSSASIPSSARRSAFSKARTTRGRTTTHPRRWRSSARDRTGPASQDALRWPPAPAGKAAQHGGRHGATTSPTSRTPAQSTTAARSYFSTSCRKRHPDFPKPAGATIDMTYGSRIEDAASKPCRGICGSVELIQPGGSLPTSEHVPPRLDFRECDGLHLHTNRLFAEASRPRLLIP